MKFFQVKRGTFVLKFKGMITSFLLKFLFNLMPRKTCSRQSQILNVLVKEEVVLLKQVC